MKIEVDISFRPNYCHSMQWLNYHHLLYFWLVARNGGLAKASAELHLAPSTISGQIHAFEHVLGKNLFSKSGRKLVLTDVGRIVFRYAEEIFNLGRELQDVINDRPTGYALILTIGVADVFPKLIAQRLIEPAFHHENQVRLVCREGKPDRLLADLALFELDMFLTDSPANPSVRVKAFNHLLGSSGISFFSKNKNVSRDKRFPSILHGAPILLPTENTVLRRSLEQWFEREKIKPIVIGEFEDSALLFVFGQAGNGYFPGPTVIARDIERKYGVYQMGEVPDIKEHYYAVTVARKLKHPAVVTIAETARQKLFVG